IAYAISPIFVFNVVAVILSPPLGHLFSLDQHAFGIWAGTAINDTSSVVAAAYTYGHAAGDAAVVTKLARTTMIVPIALGLAALQARRAGAGTRRPIRKLLPTFLLWFMLTSALSSAGLVTPRIGADLARTASLAPLELTPVQHLELVDQLREQGVVGGVGDLQVQLDVGRREQVEPRLGRGGGLLEALRDPEQDRERRATDPPCRPVRRGGLEQHAHVGQLVEVRRRRQPLAGRLGVGSGANGDERARAATYDDEPARLEPVRRLAHGEPADAEDPRQLPLRGQPRAGAHGAELDQLRDARFDLRRQRLRPVVGAAFHARRGGQPRLHVRAGRARR